MSHVSAQRPSSPVSFPAMSTLLSNVGMSVGQSDGSASMVSPVVRAVAEIFGPDSVLTGPPASVRVGSTFVGSVFPYHQRPPRVMATTARTAVMMRPHRGLRGFGAGST